MKRKVIFNVGEHLTRVALLEGQDLAELFIEKNDNVNAVGNIYKGVVQEVIPSLQAIFVDIGTGKNAFLHFNDVDLEPFIAEAIRDRQSVRRRSRNRPREGAAPDQGYYIRVEDCISRGREIMVQMTKEPISTKGARISANLTLPGRYLVMLPGTEGKGGVSKKIEDMAERRRLKRILAKIDVPDCSFIIRTAGIGRSAKEIYADVDNLLDRWEDVQQNFRKSKGATLLSSEQDFFSRLIRDHFPDEVDEIIVDHAESRDQIVAGLEEIMPDMAGRVKLYKEPRNIFERYRVERSIYTALMRKVPLKSGGYLIIDECEALTVIDINSGSFTKGGQQEKMIQRVNLEACEEIARQLRLRDIGGLIIIDFIDMATRDGQRKVSDKLREELHKDRTKVSIGRFSDFGTLELTRKRVRNSLRNTLTKECPYCGGSSRIAIDSVVWKQIRYELEAKLSEHKGGNYELIVHPHLSDYISEHLSHRIAGWEKEYGVRIDVRVQKTYHFETFAIVRNGKALVESGMDKIESFHDVEYLESNGAPKGSGRGKGRDEDDESNRGGRSRRGGRRRRGRRGDDDEAPRSEQPRAEADDELELDVEETEETGRDEENGSGNSERPRRRRRGGRGRRRRDEQPAAAESAPEPDRDEEEDDDDNSTRPRRRRRGAREAILRAQEEEDEAPVAPADDVFEDDDDEEEEEFAEVATTTSSTDDDLEDDDIFEEEFDVVTDDPREPGGGGGGGGGGSRDPNFDPDDDGEEDDEDDEDDDPEANAEAERVAARARALSRDHSNTMYGDLAGVVKTKRRSKRPRFDHNQTPMAHYSEIALGHRVGSGLPAKVARPARKTIELKDGETTEESLMAREYAESTSGKKTRRTAAKKATASKSTTTAKTTPAKKTTKTSAAKSTTAKKSTTTRKTAAKKATASKSTTTAKKAPAKKTTKSTGTAAKKTTTRASAAKKTSAAKSTTSRATKTAAKKPAAKKTTAASKTTKAKTTRKSTTKKSS